MSEKDKKYKKCKRCKIPKELEAFALSYSNNNRDVFCDYCKKCRLKLGEEHIRECLGESL